MRSIYDFNEKWAFSKEACDIPREMPKNWHWVNLPHTWNDIDGQDGGNDYYRGRCLYAKTLSRGSLPEADKFFLEFKGANSSADVYMNGEHIAHHDGGYSTFRVDISDRLKEENFFVVAVDNSPNDKVYPQVADFTFYGGLYRKVHIICTENTHFDLENYGGNGLMVTPTVVGSDAKVDVKVWVKNFTENQKIRYTVYDSEENAVVSADSTDCSVSLFIENAKLWHGRRSPYLYTVKAGIIDGDEVVDMVSAKFGCRTFEVDSERGFILNGEEYPLRGVSRHQDWSGVGNALTEHNHRVDMHLIEELGATAVRLAHYQQDSFVYELCDELGFIVWAEIPYISKHMPGGIDNTVSQMKELIIQNYNHPSIAFWGLSNEITMGGEDESLIENHRILNDLCHEMDKTRFTVVAAVSPCPIDSEYLKIPDLVAYNHYFGWYGGEASMNGPWFDNFHKEYPDIPIGCSEYGCEGLNWHSSAPVQGDYTEEYQAQYHEQLIRQFFGRKYLFATYVWNMFDFGADARCEGGEPGQNHKGLVTFNRKYKKDAFYAYKAWLSDEPFVHLCGKRYVDRVEEVTRVTIYSNLPEVELFLNGKSLGKKKSADRFFYYDVPNNGMSRLVVKAGDCQDDGAIRKVDKMNEKYILKDKHAVLNWFDITSPEGYYSLEDRLSDIMKSEEGAKIISSLFEAVNRGSKVEMATNGNLMEMMGSFTLLRLTGMLGMMGVELSKEDLLTLNKKLNQIEKK